MLPICSIDLLLYIDSKLDIEHVWPRRTSGHVGKGEGGCRADTVERKNRSNPSSRGSLGLADMMTICRIAISIAIVRGRDPE